MTVVTSINVTSPYSMYIFLGLMGTISTYMIGLMTFDLYELLQYNKKHKS